MVRAAPAPSLATLTIDKLSIPKFETNLSGKIVYFKVRVKICSTKGYFVSKRFSQFEEFERQLSLNLPHVDFAPLPPKRPKFLGQSPQFLEERRILLENFLLRALDCEDVKKNIVFLTFLSTDKDGEVSGDIQIDGSESISRVWNDDDTPYEFPEHQEIRRIQIPQSKVMSDHVLYQIHCSSSTDSKPRHSHSHWVSLKRFTDFIVMMRSLHQELAITSPYALHKLPFAPPEKKSRVFNDHTDPVFVEHRRVLLEYYLNKLLRIEQAASSDIFLKFCAVPGI
uniref:PX domain-containing protein n=1 Tax=Spongospora subterranea TaxID=70186 RepID=A0A0H5R426_9EUKA|eukprot:CRZ08955.1 hypothetical protein [Spongospora subterranea]